jgi:ribosomal protein L16 Arg81 hydroxylase
MLHPIANPLIRPIGGFQPLDADGFLINTASIEKIAPQYLPIIQQVVSKVQQMYEKKWLSIYLKGSVLRGLAIDYISDLDILVIHKEEPISTDWQNDFKEKIVKEYPFLSRLDIKHFTYAQLRKDKSMKFLIKTQSVLLEGLDLTAQMAPFRISEACQLILPHLAGDLRNAKLQIPSCKHEFELKKIGSWVAKRVLRGAFEAIMVENQQYTRDLYYCCEALRVHAPQNRQLYEKWLHWYLEPIGDAPTLLAFLNECQDYFQMARLDFDEMLAPITVDVFFKEYWLQKPLWVQRQQMNYYNDLLTITDIENYLYRNHDLRYPQIRLVQNGKEIPISNYKIRKSNGSDRHYEHLINKNVAFEYFNQGATLILNQHQRCNKQLSAFCEALQTRFKCYFQTNLYFSTAHTMGFTPHWDNHEVFALQIYGEKIWKIYDKVADDAPQSQSVTLADDVKPLLEVTLRAGDLLYVPRGYVHSVHTAASSSLHITLGAFPPTYSDFLQFMAQQLPFAQLNQYFDFTNDGFQQFQQIIGNFLSNDSILEQFQNHIQNTLPKHDIKLRY